MSDTEQNSVVDLEGMVSTITVLRIRSADLPAITAAVRAKVETMPGFFQDAPVAFDLSDVDGRDDDDPASSPCALSLSDLVRAARELGLSPVGLRSARGAREAEGRELGLGALRGSPRTRREEEIEVEPVEATPEDAHDRRTGSDRRRATPSHLTATLTLRQPLRGGQVVYAERADAIVLAPVNSGAELIADGNIHVYGALRGRALAGAHGDEQARIFCQSLEADLVSIAGTYLRADELPEQFAGKPVQIWLEGGQLRLAKLG